MTASHRIKLLDSAPSAASAAAGAALRWRRVCSPKSGPRLRAATRKLWRGYRRNRMVLPPCMHLNRLRCAKSNSH